MSSAHSPTTRPSHASSEHYCSSRTTSGSYNEDACHVKACRLSATIKPLPCLARCQPSQDLRLVHHAPAHDQPPQRRALLPRCTHRTDLRRHMRSADFSWAFAFELASNMARSCKAPSCALHRHAGPTACGKSAQNPSSAHPVLAPRGRSI